MAHFLRTTESDCASPVLVCVWRDFFVHTLSRAWWDLFIVTNTSRQWVISHMYECVSQWVILHTYECVCPWVISHIYECVWRDVLTHCLVNEWIISHIWVSLVTHIHISTIWLTDTHIHMCAIWLIDERVTTLAHTLSRAWRDYGLAMINCSFKKQVSLAEYRLFSRTLMQKRPDF